MSTSETYTYSLGPCPCGGGQIIHNILSQDNPWSGTDHSYKIECAACRKDWRLEHGATLVRVSSEQGYNSDQFLERQCYEKLQMVMRSLVEHYFTQFAAKTKKAEWKEIIRLDLSGINYRNYLAYRRAGKSISDVCHGLRNVDWLKGIAQELGASNGLEVALGAHAQAKKRSEISCLQIERRKVR